MLICKNQSVVICNNFIIVKLELNRKVMKLFFIRKIRKENINLVQEIINLEYLICCYNMYIFLQETNLLVI
jgi:hypothetical protein